MGILDFAVGYANICCLHGACCYACANAARIQFSQFMPLSNFNAPRHARGTREQLRITMPKMKTHKGAQKRFRVTKNGKLLRRKQGGNHLRRKKRKVSEYRHKITSKNGSQIKLIKSLIN